MNFLNDEKIIDVGTLINRNFKLVMTNGIFDWIGVNHVCYLQQAKLLGDKLLVVLNSDESTKRLKGQERPIVPLAERMKIMAALQCVDYVSSFSEDTPLETIIRVKPDLVVKGGDYTPEQVVGYGVVPVMVLDKFDTMSTTDKLKRIGELK